MTGSTLSVLFFMDLELITQDPMGRVGVLTLRFVSPEKQAESAHFPAV